MSDIKTVLTYQQIEKEYLTHMNGGDHQTYARAIERATIAALAQAQRPTDDELWDATLRDRDAYHEWSDRLAEAISKLTGVDIGEHSNANLPWANALEAIENYVPAQAQGLNPVYWQWRRKKDDWLIDHLHNTEVHATTDDSEVRCLYAAPPDYEAMKAERDRLAAEVERLKAAQPTDFGAEFLSKRLARVAKLAGVSMPDMTHRDIAGAAGTILGQIASKLERASQPQEAGQARELTDDEIVKALHSVGIDTYPSKFGFDALQVSATSVPNLRKAIKAIAQSSPVVLKYTTAMGEAAQRYLDQFKFAHPLPAQFRWSAVWDAMLGAASAPITPAVPEDESRARKIAEQAQQMHEDRTHVGNKIYVNDLVWALGVLAAAPSAPQQKEGDK